MATSNQQLLKTMSQFVNVAGRLQAEWDTASDIQWDALNNSYPFHLSFDELLAQMVNWRDTVRLRLARER